MTPKERAHKKPANIRLIENPILCQNSAVIAIRTKAAKTTLGETSTKGLSIRTLAASHIKSQKTIAAAFFTTADLPGIFPRCEEKAFSGHTAAYGVRRRIVKHL